MNSIYLPLALDSNYQPLPVTKQLAIALVRATSKSVKIRKATLIGWPLLLVKHEKSGGFIIFDQTLAIETKLQFIILQDYRRVLDQLENNKNESEVLAILRSFRWKEVKGYEEEIFKGIIADDINTLFSYGSPELPLKILDKYLSQIDIESSINDINSRENTITENINRINEIEGKVNTVITIIKGKRAEERKQVEDKYNALIQERAEALKKQLSSSKKSLETELSSEASKLYSKMGDIEVMIGKMELDYEADNSFQRDLENMINMRSRYLNEIQSRLSEIKNKYKIEIRNIKRDLEALKIQKQKELDAIDLKIKELDELQKNIINQLEGIKQVCNNELERLRLFIKRAPFDKDRVEVILPLLVVVDINNSIRVIPPQIYNNKKSSSFFGFLKKDPSEISTDINVNLSTFSNIILQKYANLEDNIRSPQVAQIVEQGLRELYDDGWGLKKSIMEYYG